MMISSPIISHADYLAYKHALDDIHTVYRYYKKGKLDCLEVVEGRVQKCSVNVVKEESEQKTQGLEDPFNLQQKICVINHIHAKLLQGQKEQTAGDYVLAADLYNTSLKVMQAWNRVWQDNFFNQDLLIHAPVDPESIELQPLTGLTPPLTEDKKALKRYVELLEKYPQLKRSGENNDATKGAYQIVYDEKGIRDIQALAYKRLYDKTGSHEFAAQWSRPGVVFEDAFWLIVRDCVISPKGAKHTYNRLIQKNQLEGVVGAAVMPIIKLPNGETKVSLVLNYRHATQSWEFELPRGGSLPGETAEQTAIRELKEETGYVVEHPTHLAYFPPDSGVMASLVHVFSGTCIREQAAQQEETEAIKGKYLFSIPEIIQALKRPDSSLEVQIEGEIKSYPLRDPFLVYALFLNQLQVP